ncbi:hypothetical protein TcarDRAFT_0855 [Thermosinus carboxydivorans Nor1]|uniref:Uncharacterized protein n=1 Tax=Thermosinus carboxydivorans Nor1 TaxID=401526 RepID=A1HRX8_9FIRM|nr:hypothetical protein [Thermosinus carboxydivorans]EAX47216.1 hypothetical protein TcarDRAFT_0855 [Thermosinus carboxydivorans Nor1]
MNISYAVWGVFFGWLLMPSWRKRSFRALTPLLAYATALVAGAAVTYFFHMQRQTWFFIVGMISQFLTFLLAHAARTVWWKIKNR